MSNAFDMEDWQPDEKGPPPTATVVQAMLWIVPAKAAGTWRLPQGDLKLTQTFQMLSGTLGSTPIANGKLRGDQIAFEAGGTRYAGRVSAQRGTSRAHQFLTAGPHTMNYQLVGGPAAIDAVMTAGRWASARWLARPDTRRKSP